MSLNHFNLLCMKTRHNPLILAFAILVIPLTCVFAQPAQTDNAKGPQIRFENDLTENIDYSLVLLNIDPMPVSPQAGIQDRKSTRLNSSHVKISYAVFCLKKKKNIK